MFPIKTYKKITFVFFEKRKADKDAGSWLKAVYIYLGKSNSTLIVKQFVSNQRAQCRRQSKVTV